ncbi:receptor-like cytosolic serine/threonine-protein kinase RBK1 isoform X1 [Iris pallida]|uniref:non-specific serine/threonine protein kinase n=1 Tax=Iris pallida TaxID=29817 RepID=A0AAX6EE12_IRIPA|nr:receptor-like cytosolic serine/threonine-protein kinase RBK1 isoform X1 [Iris pallida]
MTSKEEINHDDTTQVLLSPEDAEINTEKVLLSSEEESNPEEIPRVLLEPKEEVNLEGTPKVVLSTIEESNPEEIPSVLLEHKEGAEETSKKSTEECNDNNSESSDQSSPRGVFESPVSSSDSDSGCSTESPRLDRPTSSYWRTVIGGLLLRSRRSMRRLSTFPPSTARSGSEAAPVVIGDHTKENGEPREEISTGRPSWRSFEYQELAVATDNFSPDKLIGKGGHAEVYKGCLPDNQLVAVKRLTRRATEDERIGDFLSELGIIAHVNHPNAAQLLGFSVEGGLHLVLRYSPNGSLASVLHGSDGALEWKIRFKIALGVAEGLRYLHEGCQRRIIHRDIKASNILLTEDYQPQISDFGLAKWLPDKWTHHIVFPIEGTFGYLAPEYFMHGVVNEKIDVFAYGVLLLELITGRRAVDSSRQSLVIWAKPLLDANDTKGLVDRSLCDAHDPEELKRAVAAAASCIHHLSTARPTMKRVVQLLRGEEGSAELTVRPPRLSVGRPPLFDAGDAEDYTCSRYLNDLNRHKQVALEQSTYLE